MTTYRHLIMHLVLAYRKPEAPGDALKSAYWALRDLHRLSRCLARARLLLVIIPVFFGACWRVPSERPMVDTNPVPSEPVPVAWDGQGDPLPQGAVARLGTLRWRHRGR